MRAPLLTAILAAIAAGCGDPYVETELCLDVEDDATECPASADIDEDALFSTGWCDTKVKDVTGEGTLQESYFDTGDIWCCYPAVAKDAEPGCAVGRPFIEDGRTTTAPIESGDGWCEEAPSNGPIDASLAQAWLGMARMEHASVAAFARLTLDLMALGAPADLLAQVQQAAMDEVQHAKLCFTLASRFSGTQLQAGPFPFQEPISPSADAIAVAVAAVREGCLGETVGAWLAAKSAEAATDPQVRSVLQQIAEDEARHAALSWRIVSWLIQVGGAPVREAVIQAFREPFPVSGMTTSELHQQFGLLSHADLSEVCESAHREVLRPAVQALVAS